MIIILTSHKVTLLDCNVHRKQNQVVRWIKIQIRGIFKIQEGVGM